MIFVVYDLNATFLGVVYIVLESLFLLLPVFRPVVGICDVFLKVFLVSKSKLNVFTLFSKKQFSILCYYKVLYFQCIRHIPANKSYVLG